MKSYTTYTPYDIKTAVTEAVIESHLRVSYSDETAYLDALVAAAWKHVEDFLGFTYGAGTTVFESTSIDHKFELPVDGTRISAIDVQYWNGTSYSSATTVHRTGIGYPTVVSVDSDDAAYDAATLDDTIVATKGTVTISEEVPTASVQQAFLLYLSHLYENREAVVVGAGPRVMPLAFQALLTPYKKAIVR